MLANIKAYLSRNFLISPAKKRSRGQIKSLKENVKIIVGSGPDIYKGWVSTDIHQLDLLKKKDWKYLFRGTTISNILAEHVWEHLTLEDARIANKLCYQFLTSGGRMRLAVPDGYFPDASYIEYVRPGGSGSGADDHKILYNYVLMTEELKRAGFTVELLEYWDENGIFHYNDWDPEIDGIIHRSKRFDERNSSTELKYTSLIIDAIKNDS